MATLVPGPLAVFHRLFIAVAVLAVAAYGAWELRQWTGGADGWAVVRAALAFGLGAAMAVYLWRIRTAGPPPRG